MLDVRACKNIRAALLELVFAFALAKRQVRGGQESPEMGVCCLSNRLTMFDSAIESLTHVDSNALFRF